MPYRLYSRTLFAMLVIGMFLGPTLFGSAAGAFALIAGLAWSIECVVNEGIIHKTPTFILIWIAAALCFFPIYLINNDDIHNVVFGFNQFAFVLSFGVYHIAAKKLTYRHFDFVGIAGLLGLILCTVWCIVSYLFLGNNRVSAILGAGPNLLARTAIILYSFLSVYSIYKVKTGSALKIHVLALALTATVVSATGSKGSMLVLPFPFFLFLITYLIVHRSNFEAKKLAFAAIALVLFVLAVVVLEPNQVLLRGLMRIKSIFDGSDVDASTAIRIEMWKLSWSAFQEAPIFGTGWNSFGELALNTKLHTYSIKIDRFDFHADILNFAVAAGLLGVLLYACFIFAPLASHFRGPQLPPHLRYMNYVFPITALALGLTDSNISYDLPAMLYAFSFALIYGIEKQN